MFKSFAISVLILLSLSESYSQTPNVLWSKLWGGASEKNDCAFDCISDGQQYLYITGQVRNSNTSNSNDVITIKYNQSTGDTVWTRIYNGPANKDDEGAACTLGYDESLYVVGYSDISLANDKDDQMLILKYNATSGSLIWAKTYGLSAGSPIPDEGASGCAFDGNYLYVSGYANTNYMKLWKVNTAGDTLWTRSHNEISEAHGCAIDNSGNIYVSGYTFSGGIIKLALWKYNSSGTLQWLRYASDPVDNSLTNSFSDCKVRGNSIFLTGLAGNTSNRYGVALRYNDSGDTIWVKRNDSPSVYDQNHRSAIDNSGDLYVAATRYNGTNDDWVILKYKGTDGALLWTIVYNHSTNNSDYAIACALDNAGYLYATGMVNFNNGNSDILTVKYENTVGIRNISSEIPEKYTLSQNYPNPFNPVTKIGFSVPKTSYIRISVFDNLGKEVDVLVNQQLQPGIYEVDWNSSDSPSGVYYYKIRSGGFTETKKMLKIK